MKIQILDRAKKKKFIAGLADLGMRKIPELLIRSGTERIRAYSGDLSTEQIMDFWRIMPIEGIGLYVGKELMNRNGVRETRLSLDGMHVWKEQLTKRIVLLTAEQEDSWFEGKDIALGEAQGIGGRDEVVGEKTDDERFLGEDGEVVSDGFVCVKGGEDFVGNGKIGGEGRILINFLPKERRRKSMILS